MKKDKILVNFVLGMVADCAEEGFSWSRDLSGFPEYLGKVEESDLAPVHVGKGSRKAYDRAMLWNLDPHIARNVGKKTRDLGQCERCYTSQWEGNLA